MYIMIGIEYNNLLILDSCCELIFMNNNFFNQNLYSTEIIINTSNRFRRNYIIDLALSSDIAKQVGFFMNNLSQIEL